MPSNDDTQPRDTKRRLRNIPQPDPEARYWRLPAVTKYTQRGRASIYADPGFPKPVRLSANTSAWISTEVIAWCEAREAEAGRAAE